MFPLISAQVTTTPLENHILLNYHISADGLIQITVGSVFHAQLSQVDGVRMFFPQKYILQPYLQSVKINLLELVKVSAMP